VLTSILAKATAAITPQERQAILNKWLILEDTQKDKLKRFYLILMALAGIFLAIGGFMLLWNRQLARRIARRTASLDKALAREESLVLELHNRTNNALNVIISMLQLEISATAEAGSRQALQDILNLPMAMGLVCQKLDGTSSFTHIDLAAYLSELTTLLLESSDSAERIQLNLDLAPTSILYDIAIPCGFIISELVAHSHAGSRTADNPAAIAISLRHSGDHGLILEYTDASLTNADIMADQDLMVLTAEHQLQGQIQFRSEPGTSLACTIQFRDNVYAGRI